MIFYAGLPVILAAYILKVFGGGAAEQIEIDLLAVFWRGLLVAFGYAAAVFDIKTKKIPNGLVLTMLAAWAVTLAPKIIIDAGAAVELIKSSALGFAAGGLIFLAVYIISRKGLGGGDVKFMAAVGLYIGFSGALAAMLYGTLLAALTGVTLLLMKKIGRKDAIPLAPFLYAGILIALFFGQY